MEYLLIREIDTPVGRLKLITDTHNLLNILFPGKTMEDTCVFWEQKTGLSVRESTAESTVMDQACRELEEYFTGRRKQFDVPLKVYGTDFQKKVWEALKQIPYGHTASYREIGQRIDNPGAVRAVGSANGRNRIPIIIPCHRVINASGHLGGYGGGLNIKTWLLNHESNHGAV